MAWQTGTSTDFVDLLDDLITLATTQEAASATVAAGGSGYSQDEDLTLSGGTFGSAAVFNIDSVDGGGAVLTVSVINGSEGDYTVTPSNPVSTTGGSGSGCTLNVTWDDKYGWQVKRRTQKGVSATVAAGGTGYSQDEDLTVVGGVGVGTAAVFNIDSVSGGVVQTVSLVTAGDYAEVPSNPVATTGGSGSGCTLNVTWTDNDTNYNEAILCGEGAGSDEIYVGIRTFKEGTSAYNWEIAGMTGYNASLTYENQPGISPGRYDDPTPTNRPGAYVPLNNSTITYWMSVTSRRIILMAKMGSTYPNMYLGWLNPFGTSSEYPYPLLVMGCQSEYATVFSDTKIAYSGMTDPIADNDDGDGPGYVRDPGGSWRAVQNSDIYTGQRRTLDNCVVWPCGQPDQGGASADRYFSTVLEMIDVIPGSGNPGSPAIEILQTMDSPNYRSIPFPATIIESDPDQTALGELDNVFWVSAITEGSNIVTEDTITVGSDTYKVFQNCNRSNAWAMFCVKQE